MNEDPLVPRSLSTATGQQYNADRRPDYQQYLITSDSDPAPGEPPPLSQLMYRWKWPAGENGYKKDGGIWPSEDGVLRCCINHTDYRCENGRFRVSTSCVTISNLNFISTGEAGVNPGIKTWKKQKSAFLNELDVRKPLVVFISQRRREEL
jgi:hypothetical protein